MGHLKHNGTHLVHNTSDHLVDECASCPDDYSHCADVVYADLDQDCDNNCSGTYEWTWDSTFPQWVQTSGPCSANPISCTSPNWYVDVPVENVFDNRPEPNGHCSYYKSATDTSCPIGTYSLDGVGSDCSDCASEITVYS